MCFLYFGLYQWALAIDFVWNWFQTYIKRYCLARTDVTSSLCSSSTWCTYRHTCCCTFQVSLYSLLLRAEFLKRLHVYMWQPSKDFRPLDKVLDFKTCDIC
jgi:hypothetical protein